MGSSTGCVNPSLLCFECGCFLFVSGPFTFFRFYIRAFLFCGRRPPHFSQQSAYISVAHIWILLLDKGTASLTILQERTHGAFWCEWVLLSSPLRYVPWSRVRTLFKSVTSEMIVRQVQQ